jgi:signal transduction histidine kinase
VNLLSNAVKFSPAGSTVLVTVATDGVLARLSVRDYGTGIPPEFHDRIFQKFAQADASDTRRRDGTGLGLAISRQLVAAHGGQIGFSTVAGEGTTFTVDLPLAT